MQRKPPKPADLICGKTLAILKPVIVKALAPFPDAGSALAQALFRLEDQLLSGMEEPQLT